VDVDEFRRLSGVLDHWCETEGREPGTVRRAINLSFNLSADAKDATRVQEDLRRQWGPAYPRIAGGSLLGTPDEAADRVLAYVDAGADDVTVALRAPWDEEALSAYLEEIVPRLRKELSTPRV
jgi:alkanesulfonate monooxygenase SsuD/methylene tetrahydromethanopterin reductase-like flavin-dependent oxidoreductase (luciferase family)